MLLELADDIGGGDALGFVNGYSGFYLLALECSIALFFVLCLSEARNDGRISSGWRGWK